MGKIVLLCQKSDCWKRKWRKWRKKKKIAGWWFWVISYGRKNCRHLAKLRGGGNSLGADWSRIHYFENAYCLRHSWLKKEQEGGCCCCSVPVVSRLLRPAAAAARPWVAGWRLVTGGAAVVLVTLVARGDLGVLQILHRSARGETEKRRETGVKDKRWELSTLLGQHSCTVWRFTLWFRLPPTNLAQFAAICLWATPSWVAEDLHASNNFKVQREQMKSTHRGRCDATLDCSRWTQESSWAFYCPWIPTGWISLRIL